MSTTTSKELKMQVLSSKYNWPDVKGSGLAWAKGDVAKLHSKHGRPSIEVVVQAGPMKHSQRAGMVCEVLFPQEHGGDVCAVDADQLEPLFRTA